MNSWCPTEYPKLKKANLDRVFGKSRSGMIAHKNKKELRLAPSIFCPGNKFKQPEKAEKKDCEKKQLPGYLII
jgi:hypothetical protein